MSTALLLGLTCALGGVAIGALLGFAGPLVTLAVLAALALGLWALRDMEIGLWGTLAVIALLPFGSLPFKFVLTPTFLDAIMGAVLLVYLMQWMQAARRRPALTPAHGLILAFMLLSVFSFIYGLNHGPLTPNLLRKFAEFLLSLGFAFVVVDYADTRERLSRLTRVILALGAAAALIGLGLYYLPETTSNRLLNTLGRFGYPTGAVLRYIEDNPENAQRAIGTSVDPNVLGGFLAIVGGLAAPQIVARRPRLGSRRAAAAMFAVLAACLALTFSRGAMFGLAMALAGLGLARYRRLLWVLVLGALLLMLLPAAQAYVVHFAEGVQGQDLATQMRIGEYQDAFKLIGRYPVIGVGFAGAPDLDIYLGVASAYLTIAEEMGLVGLAVFLAIFAVLYGWAFVHRQRVYADPELEPIWLGLHAGLGAALVVGVLDHYFFNLEFQPAGTFFWMMVGLALAATRLAAGAEPRDAPICHPVPELV